MTTTATAPTQRAVKSFSSLPPDHRQAWLGANSLWLGDDGQAQVRPAKDKQDVWADWKKENGRFLFEGQKQKNMRHQRNDKMTNSDMTLAKNVFHHGPPWQWSAEMTPVTESKLVSREPLHFPFREAFVCAWKTIVFCFWLKKLPRKALAVRRRGWSAQKTNKITSVTWKRTW